MQLFQTDKYASDAYVNPSDQIPVAQKFANDGEWFKQKAQWIYSLYLRDRCGIPYSRTTDYALFRLYAKGRQPVEKYMDRLCPKDKKTNKRRMWMNLSWDILPVLPKFRDVVIGMFDKMDFKIACNAIDENSDEERNNMKFSLWVEKQHQEFLSQFDNISGTKPDEQNQNVPVMPQSLQELGMLADMGAFKLKHEIAMEKALKLSDYNSRWSETKRKLTEDFVDLGVAATKDYVDMMTQKVMSRYVDPENLIIRHDRSNDYTDITEAGELKLYSIQSVAELTGMEEDEIRRVATIYNGFYGNPTNYPNNEMYRQNRVLVLDCEFESLDTKVFQTRTGENNVPIMREEAFDFNRKSNANRTVQRTSIRQFMRCKWIVGTDIVFDYGYQYDVPRPRKNEPRSSFHIYRVSDRSIMERCIVPADMIQLNHLKLQNDMAKAPPAGIKVEWGTLNNINLGGEKMTPLDILAIYRQTGDIIYKATTMQGNVVQGAPNPVEELKGGMGQILEERIRIFEFNLNLIRDVTGINEVADASAPASGALNGTSQMALAATSNALSPILMGYKFLREQTAINLALRTQIVARNGMIEGELPALGSGNIEIIKIGAADGITLADYGILVEAVVTDADKQFILNAASQSLAAGKQGGAGINMSDFMFIKRMLDMDNIKYAEFILAAREQQEFQKQQQLQQENMQLNAQTAQQTEAAKAQWAQQMAQIQSEAKSKEISEKFQADVALDNAKTANIIKVKQAEFELEKQYGVATKVTAIQTL